MPITADDFTGADRNRRAQMLVLARSYAPCLQTLTGADRETAVAILTAVAAELPTAGSRRVKSMSRNGTSMTFESTGTFSSEDISALRALCSSPSTLPGLPRGSFPVARPIVKPWPEGEYS